MSSESQEHPAEAPLRSLRLYLASVPEDMAGERDLVEGLVLPELRARGSKIGIEIALVDPAKLPGETWDLARRFREIEACRPFFLALIGERYGDPPSAVSLELVAAQPWLVEDPGRSVLELEILHGSLRDPERAVGSLFYFRDSKQSDAESAEAAERLALLKDRIRFSGRPVFDGYPRGWSEGPDRASRLDALAERMLEDLWRAIQERVRQPAAGFDPNATILTPAMAPPPRPPLPPEVAAAARALGPPPLPSLPPLPAGYGSTPASKIYSRSRPRWMPFAVLIALAVVALSVLLLRRAASPGPTSSPPADLEDPDRVPVISVDTWPLMTRVCGLDDTTMRELPGRAQGGAPIVQVYSSINTPEALRELARFQDRGAFLLPIEIDGTTFCTVAVGPFPTLDAAREYALGLRRDGTAPEAGLAYFPLFTR